MTSRLRRSILGLFVALSPSGFVMAGENAGAKSGIDASGFDDKVRPQDDFFRYVNGGWLARTEIPPDRARYGSFVILTDKSEAALREIIEAAAASTGAGLGTNERKIGDLYASFMDQARANSLGIKPIEGVLARIAAIPDKAAFLLETARLGREGIRGLIGEGVSNDAKQSDQNILYLNQAGLSLPDEAYYRDPKHKAVREKFLAHVEKMLELAGYPDPKKSAALVLAIETDVAKNHWDRVKNRDRLLTYNKMTRAELAKLAPAFDWPAWFKEAGADAAAEVIVRQPGYFSGLSALYEKRPLEDWKTWLAWRVIREAAPLLSDPFVQEDFAFNDQTLAGTPSLRPRWKRGVEFTARSMGEAVGQIYVAKHFPPAAKERMKELVANLTAAYHDDIKELEWMSPETRRKALEKLAKFNPKIGYPDVWRDYSKLEVGRDDLLGNARRADRFESDRDMAKLSKPVDRKEWHMTPQTVNAYYNPTMNEIVFPAAILQPPFFDLNADDAVNYGAIGAVIGHEIGHGFDDQGSRSNGDGNLVNWWTEQDRAKFETRTKALIDQYSSFEPVQLPGQKVNGALTIGENIGDLGGLSIAYKAWKRSLNGAEAAVIDGMTGDQRFFIGWAQAWRLKSRDAAMARALATDPHSPAEFRCNGVLRNMPAFYAAFGVKEGDKLWLPPEKRVSIW